MGNSTLNREDILIRITLEEDDRVILASLVDGVHWVDVAGQTFPEQRKIGGDFVPQSFLRQSPEKLQSVTTLLIYQFVVMWDKCNLV